MRKPCGLLPVPSLVLALLAAAVLVFPAGCDRPEPPPDDRPARDRAVPPRVAAPPPGAPAELAHPLPIDGKPAAEPAGKPMAPEEAARETVAVAPSPPPATVSRTAEGIEKGERETPSAPPPAAVPVAPIPDAAIREALPARAEQAGRKTVRKVPPAGAAPAARAAVPQEVPEWARDGEQLSYKVTFMGVTAGYGRLISRGKVRIGGHDAYHIQAKVWTTGTLALLFPISEAYDYYLDAETLAPLRRDSMIRKVNRPEIVLFDQENGTITHWYGDTMEVRKKKQLPPPGFYDGLSATYFFRTRGFGDRSVSIRVFGGRKVYRVGSERAGEETIPYGDGKVDTYLVKPVYRVEGGSGEKPMLGDLLVWVSKDRRRVPVKLYAAFTKGLEWRLVAELQSGLAEPK